MLSILFSFLVFQQVPATASAEVGSDTPTQTTFNLDIATLGMALPKPQSGELYGVVHTSMGDITIHLFEKEAPNTVANFVGLARGTREWKDPRTRKWVKRALYKNVICHRVIPNFMIQCGDPTGTGTGTPGYTFIDEFSPNLRHNTGGLLSMANRGPNTNGSQFFITEAPAPHLDGRHTIFGEVIKNSELIGKIARVRVDAQDRPMEDVVIKSIDVFRSKKLPK